MDSHLKMPSLTSSLFVRLFCFSLVFIPPSSAHADHLLAHRAVYELMLRDTGRDSAVTGASGLFAFQITGSQCAGWHVVSNIVLTVQDSDGNPRRTETVYRTFEDGRGDVFTFETTIRTADGQTEHISGATERPPSGAMTIRRLVPEEVVSQASADTLFPGQLTEALLSAAQNGQLLFFGSVFDGSDDNGLAQPVSGVLGGPVAPSVLSPLGYQGQTPTHPNDQGEDTTQASAWADFPTPTQAWTVDLSYFDPSEPDSTPSFRVSYTLDSNGVADDLVLDYGAFTLRGVLSDFTAFHPEAC